MKGGERRRDKDKDIEIEIERKRKKREMYERAYDREIID